MCGDEDDEVVCTRCVAAGCLFRRRPAALEVSNLECSDESFNHFSLCKSRRIRQSGRSRFIGDVSRNPITSTTSELALSRPVASRGFAYTRDCVGAIRPWCIPGKTTTEANSRESRAREVSSVNAGLGRRLHVWQTSEGERWSSQRPSTCTHTHTRSARTHTQNVCGHLTHTYTHKHTARACTGTRARAHGVARWGSSHLCIFAF